MIDRKSVERFTRALLQNADGVTAIEYGLLAALIAIACIGAFQATGTSLGIMYAKWTAAIMGAL
jgi:pilus assembly protein Flp/PilA